MDRNPADMHCCLYVYLCCLYVYQGFKPCPDGITLKLHLTGRAGVPGISGGSPARPIKCSANVNVGGGGAFANAGGAV